MVSPRELSTHLQFHHIPEDIKRRKCQIVYVQRNPKDVCVSFDKFMQSEMNSDISWNDYVHLFANADEANYHFWMGITLGSDKAIRDNPDFPILLNPYQEIRRIAEFLGVSTDEVVHKTEFKNMRTARLEFLSEETKSMSTEDARKSEKVEKNITEKYQKHKGTNWTWEIVNMLVRESADYQRDRKTPTLLEFQTHDYFEKMTSPRILSTHLRFNHVPNDMKKRKCKIIFIQRNPKDVAVSYHNYMRSEMFSKISWGDYVPMFVNADQVVFKNGMVLYK
ncbi:hypothetical protein KUTeg_013787 [Tegillarca granosa]|uniref:Sulfotransferase domain-containing protein n=1 Tax=Tegillarca granosa TaxID=220873 RepID=A0ABQ9EUP2_TEGGR|nr:hypothetical protein KUTeg_013787 [Tegillarca granosa]